MIFAELLELIDRRPGGAVEIMLPDRSFVPAHFHVTEVGLVRKDFIDCGGTIRTSSSGVLQVWVAEDREHRLDTTKLSRILRLAAPLFPSIDLPVEIEYGDETISQYPLVSAEFTPLGVMLKLGRKPTSCLAPDRCGVSEPATACCGPGCC